MAEIIYFGTNGCSGHYPIGIDKTLTGAEYEIWRECDNETWINNIRKNPGRHVIKHHGEVYTNYGVPFSVDEYRVGSHTELFWKGIHTKEEIVNLIKNNQFLARQFKMDEAIKDVATVCGVRYEDIKSAINMTQVFAGGKKKENMNANKITLAGYIVYLQSMYKRYGNISIAQLKHIERNRKKEDKQ